MSFDGSGNYTVPTGTAAVSGAVIDSAKYNALLTDLQTALTKCLLRDGQSAALANISMGSFRITSLASGINRTDAATLGQVQDESANLLTTVAGTTAITANCVTPTLGAYITGLRLTMIATADSTGAVTLNVNSLGAKNVMLGATQASTQDILTGRAYTLVYDGTSFQLSGGGGSGATGSGVFYENNQTLAADYTLATGKNAMSAGPITINSGVTVTVPTGAVWSIV